MLTALVMAVVLGQAPHSCATCGANSYGAEEGATGWFPICSPKGWNRIWNMCNGPIIGLGAAKCPCPLGVPVPCGDTWAMQMHTNYAAPVPVRAPATAPAPNRPAEGAATPPPSSGAPQPGPPATPPEPPPATSPSPLTPLP
jgi:hypothetical protein